MVDDPVTPPWVREVPAVQVLRRVWPQQFSAPDEAGRVRWHTAGELPRRPS